MGTLKRQCQVCGLKTSGVFAGLSGTLLEKLDREKATRIFKAGQVLFYEGEMPLATYCVSSGRIKIYKSDPSGADQIIRLMDAGELIGFRALLSNEPYAATAQAIEDSTVCTIDKNTFLDLIRQSSDLALDLLAKLARELRISEEQILAQARQTIRQRVANMILHLIGGKIENLQAPIDIRTSLKKYEMAQMIGTSPISFSRELHKLAKLGILATAGSRIQILDIRSLQEIARQDN
jgi:CRP/FNR family transcriptional regulator